MSRKIEVINVSEETAVTPFGVVEAILQSNPKPPTIFTSIPSPEAKPPKLKSLKMLAQGRDLVFPRAKMSDLVYWSTILRGRDRDAALFWLDHAPDIFLWAFQRYGITKVKRYDDAPGIACLVAMEQLGQDPDSEIEQNFKRIYGLSGDSLCDLVEDVEQVETP